MNDETSSSELGPLVKSPKNEKDSLKGHKHKHRQIKVKTNDIANDNETRILFGISMKRDVFSISTTLSSICYINNPQSDSAYYLIDAVCLLLLIAVFVYLAVAVQWDDYAWRFYMGFGCLMILCILLSEVNHHRKFQSMTAYFYAWRYVFIALFFVLAFVDFILLEMSDVTSDCDWSESNDPDCPLLNPDENGMRICVFNQHNY